MIGLGTQDDFAYAQDFIADTGVTTPTMLWDPSFVTWSTFGVNVNSQMMLLAPDLSARSDVWFGFGEEQRQGVLDAAAELA